MLYNMLYTLGKPVVPLQIKHIVLSEKTHTHFYFRSFFLTLYKLDKQAQQKTLL